MLMPRLRAQRPRLVAPLFLTTATALAACFGTVLAAGCGNSAAPAAAGAEARSMANRITTPGVPEADAAELAADNRAFGVDLHGALRTQPGNLVYSPASISIALAMLYGGAAGLTATEMAQALHFNLPPERLHPAFNALDLALEAPTADGTAFRLALANSAWGQAGYTFLQTYLDLLAENYGAGMRLADFSGDTEGARQQINEWAADHTEQLIKELVARGVLDGLTTLVLTNAVYFKADWQMPFGPSSADATFHAPSGDLSVPMMRGPDALPIWTGDGFRAAMLPYAGGTTSMVVVVPDAGTYDMFEQSLTGDRLGAILAGASSAQLGPVILPRFKFTTKLDLAQTLQSLGVKQAFNAATADLSGIDGLEHHLYVKYIVHQATIAVDEKGTEAAAATAVIISRKGVPLVSLSVDRPFLFLIRDDATGAILFQGRVLDPTL
jgi:serpin B